MTFYYNILGIKEFSAQCLSLVCAEPQTSAAFDYPERDALNPITFLVLCGRKYYHDKKNRLIFEDQHCSSLVSF